MSNEEHPTTWVEISAGALQRNWRAVAQHAGVPVCAVVKANAYGHGLAQAARTFEQAGARWLAVTRVEEARALRAAGVQAHVLVLTPPPTQQALAEAIGLGCSVALADATDVMRFATAARSVAKPALVHLKIDTGMGRLGVTVEEAAPVAARIADEQDLVLEGVFTHFADAAGPGGAAQLERFATVRIALGKHAARALVHASNSAATLALPDARFDMVRVGTLLYGQNPPGAKAPFPLEETFHWYASVVAVRTIPAGGTVGYGSEWKAKRTERVATLAIGWADGFTAEPNARTPSVTGAVTATAKTLARAAGAREDDRVVRFGSRRAKVIGRVGMQTVTVSLTGIPDVAVGDAALVPARRLLVNPAIDRVYVP